MGVKAIKPPEIIEEAVNPKTWLDLSYKLVELAQQYAPILLTALAKKDTGPTQGQEPEGGENKQGKILIRLPEGQDIE